MKIRLLAFGIAREIIDGSVIEIDTDGTISGLKQKLMKDYPDFTKLASLRFAVNEEYQPDSYRLREDDEVVIIPPVSGG